MAKDKDNPQVPEFKPEYFWAFASLMLHKIGGTEAITLKHLKKFDAEESCPDVVWDADAKAFVMKSKIEGPDDKVLVAVPRKMLRKKPRLMLS